MDASPLAMFDARTDAVTRAQPAASRVAKTATKAEAEAAGEKFEAMFLSQMFQYMFEGLDSDPVFGGGNAENMYRSLMVDEYGKQVAKHGGIGIADHVTRTLLAAQEKHP